MYKKLFFLVSLLIVFGLVGNASATDHTWSDLGSGHLWSNANNWLPTTLPASGDNVFMHYDPNFVPEGSREWPILDSGTVTVTELSIGFQWIDGPRYDPPDSDPPNEGVLTMTGGSLTASNLIRIAEKGYGTFNMTGGDVYTGSFQLGRDGPKTNVTRSTAVWNMSGGTYHGGNLSIPNSAGIAHLQVEGNAVIESSALQMDEQISGGGAGTLDINSVNARVSPLGDERDTINGFIDNGWITAFGYTNGTIVNGQRATLFLDYNLTALGRTTLVARWTDPNKASLPDPADGGTAELDQNNKVTLRWLPSGVERDVYYGTTWADVNNGTGGTFQGKQSGETFYTPALATGNERFWRIDEYVADWSGATTLINDGFESDSGKWATPTGDWVQMNSTDAHTGSNSSGFYGKNLTGTLTSINLDTSDACAVSVDFWYKTDAKSTMDLLFYNGSTYDVIADDLSVDAEWTNYSTTTTNANYRRADFKIQFDGIGGSSSSSCVLVDDVLVKKLTTVELYKGDVWSFTVADYLVIEDFFAYPDDANLGLVWDDGIDNGTNATIAMTSGSEAMAVTYDNLGDTSEADCTPAISDWTQQSVKALSLLFRGVSTNEAEQMYVEIGDGGTPVKVNYTGNPNDLRLNEWQEWNIPLSSFAGVDRNSVTFLCIGFGVGSSAGTVDIDDIRLYPSRCVADQSQPAGDLDDDCTVDNNDVDLLTDDWVISDANIATSSPSATGQVAYYDFEGDFQDSWANAIHGTAIDDAAIFNDSGGRGNVLKLDGTGDYVDCTSNANFDITGSITVAAWIKPTFFDKDYQAFVTKGNTAWRILRLNAPDSLRFGHEGLSSVGTGAYSSLNDGQWHHVAGVYDSSAQKTYAYIDGLAETTNTGITGTIDTNAYKVLIGADDSQQPGREFDGLIDEVRIYSRALSQAEIAYLAADGAANLYIPPRSIANIYVDGADDDAVNFKDLAKMLQATWATEQTWP